MPGNPRKQRGKSTKALLEYEMSSWLKSLGSQVPGPAGCGASLRQLLLESLMPPVVCPSQNLPPTFLSGLCTPPSIGMRARKDAGNEAEIVR